MKRDVVDACIHIIDDDEDVRKALSYLMASAGFASRLYASADQFLTSAGRDAAGCIVTDVRMPGISGIELVLKLRSTGVPHPVIVISGHADMALAVKAMKAGAVDFLEKPFNSDELVAAVTAALVTERPKLPLSAESLAFLKVIQLLSPRQRDAFYGILDGKLSKTTAHELGISIRTLEGYRAEVMGKTQARNANDLMRMAGLANLWGSTRELDGDDAEPAQFG